MNIMEAAARPNIEPLLEGARCLVYLEMDMERTYELFAQLEGLHDLAVTSHQYQWASAWCGRGPASCPRARAALHRAIELASTRSDHWASFECSARLTMLDLEAGDPQAARARSEQLAPLAAKLGGSGSEPAYTNAIAALVAFARRERAADVKFETAIAELNRIDARFLTPDLLGIAAEAAYRAGDLATATTLAEPALAAAQAVDRRLEVIHAHALLACIAARRGALEDSETASRRRGQPRGEISGARNILVPRGRENNRPQPVAEGSCTWQPSWWRSASTCPSTSAKGVFVVQRHIERTHQRLPSRRRPRAPAAGANSG